MDTWNSVEEQMQSYARSLQGKRSRASGEHFEQMIMAAADFYEKKGIAVVQKTPEPTKILKAYDRKKGQFVCCFAKKAQPDFKGILKDSTMILFDAKHTDGHQIDRKAVTDEQESCFDRHIKYGAQCYVVISLRFQKFYRVPWVVFRDMKKIYGHKFMNEKELAPYELKYVNGILRFLDGIEPKEEGKDEINQI